MTESSADDQDGERRSQKRPVLLKVKGSRFMREKLQGKTFLIPSFITVTAVFCGFLAIISALKGQFEYATKCIALAIVLDGLDGRVARKLNATSEFGREFDSLSDLVAFGVAPGVLVYCWAFSATADEFGVLIAFIYVVCTATRLARFNINTGKPESSKSFCGLPSPGAAAAIAALVYCFPDPISNEGLVGCVMVYMVLFAGLMVSTFPFLSVKHLKLTQGNPRLNLVVLAIAVALLWKYNRAMILFGSALYGLSGFIGFIWQRSYPESWEKQRRLLGLRS